MHSASMLSHFASIGSLRMNTDHPTPLLPYLSRKAQTNSMAAGFFDYLTLLERFPCRMDPVRCTRAARSGRENRIPWAQCWADCRPDIQNVHDASPWAHRTRAEPGKPKYRSTERAPNECSFSAKGIEPADQPLSPPVLVAPWAVAPAPQRQPLISGRSSPCLTMYALCSSNLSRISCLA